MFTTTGVQRRGRSGLVLTALLALLLTAPLFAKDLQSFPGSQLVPTDWADGDSFR